AHEAMWRLALAEETARYAPAPVASDRLHDDLKTVRAALLSGDGVGVRLRAVLLPRSLAPWRDPRPISLRPCDLSGCQTSTTPRQDCARGSTWSHGHKDLRRPKDRCRCRLRSLLVSFLTPAPPFLETIHHPGTVGATLAFLPA